MSDLFIKQQSLGSWAVDDSNGTYQGVVMDAITQDFYIFEDFKTLDDAIVFLSEYREGKS